MFALEEDDDREEEEVFAVVDRQQWSTQRAAEPTFVTGAATDVRSCASHGLRDETDHATL